MKYWMIDQIDRNLENRIHTVNCERGFVAVNLASFINHLSIIVSRVFWFSWFDYKSNGIFDFYYFVDLGDNYFLFFFEPFDYWLWFTACNLDYKLSFLSFANCYVFQFSADFRCFLKSFKNTWNVYLTSCYQILILDFLPNTSKLNVCSTSPTLFDALITYLPKWDAAIFGITKEFVNVLASVSNLTLSLFVNSLSFKIHTSFGFGKASIKHSNLAVWSWIATVSFGADTNFGAPFNDELRLIYSCYKLFYYISQVLLFIVNVALLVTTSPNSFDTLA